jgi:hypothetical protein
MINHQSLKDICHNHPVVVRDVVHAPWTPEQVAQIQAFQDNPMFHELTCSTHSGQSLEVTADGLECSACDYRQTWVPSAVLVLGGES